MTVRSFLSTMGALTVILMFAQSAAFAQALPPGTTALVGAPLVDVPPLFAVLRGGNEVSGTGGANIGDPDGRGAVTAILSDTDLCFGIVVDGIAAPTDAGIYRGAAGVNGDLVVMLTAPSAGDPGTSSGCIPVADPALLTQIQSAPTSFYVSVSTGEFSTGAVRGQLF